MKYPANVCIAINGILLYLKLVMTSL